MGIGFASVKVKQILNRKGKSRIHEYCETESIVRRGHLAVYVGEEDEKKRFVVPISLLRQPSFQDLLNQSQEEYGFDHPMGGLTIHCKQDDFLNLTSKFHWN